MMIISIAIVVSFFVSLIVANWQLETFSKAGITGIDMHKIGKPEIPEMGGISAIVGFIVGLSLLLGEGEQGTSNPIFLTAVIGIVGAGFIGMVDDMVYVRQRNKAFLPFLFSLPFGIQMMNTSFDIFGFTINNPYIVLLAVPFGITCAANASNMLEGFNGMGVGLSTIYATTLIILIYITQGSHYGIYILFPLLGATLGFAVFNIYPSRIFPGDTFTLFSGAAIGSAAIISNLITPGIILFTPMIIEFFLKFKGGFSAENFAKIDEDGYLYSTNDKTESITHLIVKHLHVKEWQLVAIVWTLAGVLGSLIILFFGLM